MGDLALGEDYANFRAWVPKNVLPIGPGAPPGAAAAGTAEKGGAGLRFGARNWTYYDWGPRDFREPLVCLHGLAGAADAFFHQILSLAPRGYRVILVELPPESTVSGVCEALTQFFDTLLLATVHLYGVGLGGFIALNFAAARPDRVASLALTHAFLSTEKLVRAVRLPPLVVLKWCPIFVLQNAVVGLLPRGQVELHLAMATEFLIARTLEVGRESLIARLELALTPGHSLSPQRISLSATKITFIDAVGIMSSVSAQLSSELRSHFPQARHALMKDGADFPYLTNADEVSMHLLVHLRRNAAPPEAPMPLPPPARARVMCPEEVRRLKEAIRRSKLENAAGARSENGGEETETRMAAGNMSTSIDSLQEQVSSDAASRAAAPNQSLAALDTSTLTSRIPGTPLEVTKLHSVDGAAQSPIRTPMDSFRAVRTQLALPDRSAMMLQAMDHESAALATSASAPTSFSIGDHAGTGSGSAHGAFVKNEEFLADPLSDSLSRPHPYDISDDDDTADAAAAGAATALPPPQTRVRLSALATATDVWGEAGRLDGGLDELREQPLRPPGALGDEHNEWVTASPIRAVSSTAALRPSASATVQPPSVGQARAHSIDVDSRAAPLVSGPRLPHNFAHQAAIGEPHHLAVAADANASLDFSATPTHGVGGSTAISPDLQEWVNSRSNRQW
uniref:Maspardin n=1 Tax=Erythrolobus australicus TaxID=1077150 RepID=A0A7S1TMN2_9RHOD|mmetsp:Transcript_4261/g.11673  ORF Transcript_4261/g.11673 Transcript_4261/m.11673 type:complete len:682 (+) Transcript_4261:60-2105(+)